MSEQANNTSAHPGTAVVTGASAGLGRLFADRLARRGHDLLLVARRGDRLEEAAKALRSQYGVTVNTLVADLGAAADLERVAQAIAADTSITLLVNNAGTSTLAPVLATAPASAQSMIDVNVTALARLSLVALAGFKARDRGTLINIGSVLGFHTLPISSIYSGTKGFVLNFTRGLQEEVAGSGVRVQLVLPAATATDIWELSGVPVTNLDPAHVMTAEHCVDAAIAGLDLGEPITMPSVDDYAPLFAAYDDARAQLFGASQNGTPAARYASAAR
ncbi:SDR family oxidoreductase [Variovorax paradoxus]|uniref:SDR family NAD(P)-dependent oxidoreductase n=1 Tax=Variovorax paradoxus TaxID=34073 RepID=UPI001ABC07E1